MNIYLTKEKLSYDGGQDLYIGKINRKRLYCLNDVCRIFGIFFRETKKSLEEKGFFICGIMIKRKKRCSENAFTDYNGLIEVLLMSRYDKSSDFKRWIDAIPDASFKKCQIYVKRNEAKKARPNANNKTSRETKQTGKLVEKPKRFDKTVETKQVEMANIELPLVEFVESSSNQSSLENVNSYKETEATKDFILSFCAKENFSIEMLIFRLSHLDTAARAAYLNCKELDYVNACRNIKWLEDLQLILKSKYKSSPYYKHTPKMVAMQEKLRALKEK